MIETGETDYTAVVVPGEPSTLISPIAMEQLRRTAERERAPDDLLRLHDIDLLAALGVLRDQGLTRAGVLLAGGERAIGEHVPGYVWTHLRMRSDTQYSDRLDGRDALPIALARLIDRIMADNQIATVVEGMFHFEYRTYPEVALREALMNALGHADFRLAGPVLVKQYAGRLEVSNPGSFIGGISSSNILHHPPVARNPNLVEALTRLRLINRSSLGVPRMFEALLIEGKEPPIIEERGEGVTVTFRAGELSVPFRAFTAEEARRGRLLTVDHLLVLRYLLSHAEIDIATAARMCQRSELETRELLSQMERERDYLERGGTPRDTFWKLRAALYNRLVVPSQSTRDRRIAWEASKALVVSVLRRRAEGGDLGLTNAEVRGLTQLNRFQVFRLIGELERDGALTVERRGRSTRYVYRPAETS